MKLNYKRTILAGFAFFLISAFWQAYDTIVPLILTNKYDLAQSFSGAIMALDNVFAVFLLPIFGNLSDRTNTKYGRRTPYIVIGTVCAATFFSLIGVTNHLWSFVLILLLSLLSMASFRSPAVALMPDITVKPLRSKGNAIINLMGTLGGIIILLLAGPFKTSEAGKTDFTAYILTVCGVMLAALLVFIFTVREKSWADDMQKASALLEPEAEASPNKKAKLSKSQITSLILILASVALWYIGYNAITSKYSVYASNFLNISYSTTLLIAQAAAVICYIPAGIIASKIGRRKTILIGVVLLFTSFFGAAFIREGAPVLIMTVLFALAGVGWATINVNSFPMVVELAGAADTGKFTGYYYTASMAAQIVTPVLSGTLMDVFGNVWGLSRPAYEVLFPYAAVFCALAFVTMMFVKHGDSKIEAKKGIEALDVD